MLVVLFLCVHPHATLSGCLSTFCQVFHLFQSTCQYLFQPVQEHGMDVEPSLCSVRLSEASAETAGFYFMGKAVICSFSQCVLVVSDVNSRKCVKLELSPVCSCAGVTQLREVFHSNRNISSLMDASSSQFVPQVCTCSMHLIDFVCIHAPLKFDLQSIGSHLQTFNRNIQGSIAFIFSKQVIVLCPLATENNKCYTHLCWQIQ